MLHAIAIACLHLHNRTCHRSGECLLRVSNVLTPGGSIYIGRPASFETIGLPINNYLGLTLIALHKGTYLPCSPTQQHKIIIAKDTAYSLYRVCINLHTPRARYIVRRRDSYTMFFSLIAIANTARCSGHTPGPKRMPGIRRGLSIPEGRIPSISRHIEQSLRFLGSTRFSVQPILLEKTGKGAAFAKCGMFHNSR